MHRLMEVTMPPIFPSQQRALDRIAAGAVIVPDHLGVSLELDGREPHWMTECEWAVLLPLIPRQDGPRMAEVGATGPSQDRDVPTEGSMASGRLRAWLDSAERRAG